VRSVLLTASLLFSACLNGSSAMAADEAGALAPKGVGRDDCKALTEVYEKRSQEILLFASWLDGYITSVNTYSNDLYDLAPWQSTDLLAYLVVQFCEKSPEAKLAEAAQWLVQTLSPQRLQSKSPLVDTKSGDKTVKIYRTILQRAQEELIKRGHLSGTADGAYGPKTQAAFEAFQGANQLPKTGVPDQETLFKLFVEPEFGQPPPPKS
jgi:hypothetical protein